jgi:hypothetical protein
MFLWDLDLPMDPDDLLEVQEPPAEVLALKTRSKVQLVSNGLTIVQSSRGNERTITQKHLLYPKEIP